MTQPRQARIAGEQRMQGFPINIVSTSEDYLGNTMSDGSYYLSPGELFVVVTNASSSDYTIYLPSPAEVPGQILTIQVVLSSTGDVIVADQDDSFDWDGDKTLGDTLDYMVLLSDGRKWYNLVSDTD